MTTTTRKGRLARLRAVLASIPKARPEAVDTALSQLELAIDDYKMYSRPSRDRDGRPEDFSVAQTRKDLASLAEGLKSALEAYDGMSPPAKSLLAGEIESAERSHAELIENIRIAAEAARRAAHSAKRLPNKQADSHRQLLAMNVARVLRDTLGITPTSTRHTHVQHSGTRGGGAYSRVLEQVVIVAIGTSTDLEKLIAAGLKLLRDPDLPHNLPP